MFTFFIKKLRQENAVLRASLDFKNSEISSLQQKINELETRIGDPAEVVRKTFAKDLSWFDCEELPPNEREHYYNEAQRILRSNVFNNEINYLKAKGAQEAMLEAKDFSQVRDYQMTINGLELLEKRFKAIRKPDDPIPTDNINEAV